MNPSNDSNIAKKVSEDGEDDGRFEEDLKRAEEALEKMEVIPLPPEEEEEEEEEDDSSVEEEGGRDRRKSDTVVKTSNSDDSSCLDYVSLPGLPPTLPFPPLSLPPPPPKTGGGLKAFSLKIVYEAHKTGFEKEKDFIPSVGSVVGGVYLIEDALGEAAFSRTYRAADLRGGEEVCLKIIKSSNKDFFDQGLDECKILGVVNGEWGCLKGKGEVRS